jgi:hypothetical protein
MRVFVMEILTDHTISSLSSGSLSDMEKLCLHRGNSKSNLKFRPESPQRFNVEIVIPHRANSLLDDLH